MLGIIGAMEMEIAALKQDMKDVHVVKKAGMSFFKGKIYDKDVVIVESGIGKVNAGICTQILIDVFNIDAVINTGVAGSLNNNINICDIVVSTKAQQHDMDVTALGYERGIIPGMKESEFMADKRLIELAKCSVKKAGLDINVFEGKIVSGDRFIGTIEEKKYLRERLMETARRWKEQR